MLNPYGEPVTGIGLQLQQTALTVNAVPQSPDARMLPNSGTPSCLLSAASPC